MSKTYRDLLAEARAQVREVTTAEAEQAAEGGALLLDVREESEWEQGHVDILRGEFDALKEDYWNKGGFSPF